MNSIPTIIASYLVNSAWTIALIAGAGWLASRLLKKMGPQAEHIVWVSTLLLAILLPALPFFHWLQRHLFIPFAATGHLSVTFIAAQSGESIQESVFVLPAAFSRPLLCLYLGSLF